MPLILTKPVTRDDLIAYLIGTTDSSDEINEAVAAVFFYIDEEGDEQPSSARGYAAQESLTAAIDALSGAGC